ncbi:MAG: hypothetical protein QXX32_05570 [Thermofilum sp.]
MDKKISELEEIGLPFLVVCGERVNHPAVVYREAKGKWDAINFGAKFIPKEADIIILNDVDTKIHNLMHAFTHLNRGVDLVYCRVNVLQGPQAKFYRILDPVRKRFHIAASGELMLIKRQVFERVSPIPPCIAEDSYILFKALESKYRVHFCTQTYVTTQRTSNAKEEEAYKKRTTLGIYQALKYTRPLPWIRAFYKLLPLALPLLALAGEDGRAWSKGIAEALKDNIAKKYPTKF